MLKIDLNCDLGEGFGTYRLGPDEQLLGVVSSANIACGFHAGDPAIMFQTVRLALEKGVAIGAHPGLRDLSGFGRRRMDISPQEAYELVVYQIGALNAFVKAEGGKLHHVKPHGALYNMAALNRKLADAIALAVFRVDRNLILYGLANSELIEAGKLIGLTTASEAFPDRAYSSDGSLVPRNQVNAVVSDPESAVAQAINIATKGRFISIQGMEIGLQADTLCIHGDGANALELALSLKERLEAEGVVIRPVNS